MTTVIIHGLVGLHVEGPQYRTARDICGRRPIYDMGQHHRVEFLNEDAARDAATLLNTVKGIRAELDGDSQTV